MTRVYRESSFIIAFDQGTLWPHIGFKQFMLVTCVYSDEERPELAVAIFWGYFFTVNLNASSILYVLVNIMTAHGTGYPGKE